MDYAIRHGDYVRIQVEETRSRGSRNQLLPLTEDERKRKRDAQERQEHDRWPKQHVVAESLPRPSSSPMPRTDHGGYWICAAWVLMIAAGALMKMQCRKKRVTRRRTRRGVYQPTGKRLFLVYLVLTGQLCDSLQVCSRPKMDESGSTAWKCEDDVHSPARLISSDAFEQLPPPGNPMHGLVLTKTGKSMMDWISYVVDIEMTKHKVRQHIFECGGATQAPFLPIATECDAERSNLDFDFVSVGSQVSLQAALQDSHSSPPQSANFKT